MKLFYLLMFLSTIGLNNVSGQYLIADMYTHSWAGGVCCRHGITYTMDLSIPSNNEWFNFDSLSVCYNGSLQVIHNTDTRIIELNDVKRLSLVWSETYDEYSLDRFMLDPLDECKSCSQNWNTFLHCDGEVLGITLNWLPATHVAYP